MDIFVNAGVAEIAWMTDKLIINSNEPMSQISQKQRMMLILDRFASLGILDEDEWNRPIKWGCPGWLIDEDIAAIKTDETVAVEDLAPKSKLANELNKILSQFIDEELPSVVSYVGRIFDLLKAGLLVDCGRSLDGERWVPTEKARQLGADHGLDVPVGPMQGFWVERCVAEMDEIVSWYVGFLSKKIFEGLSGPLIERSKLNGGNEELIADLQSYLQESGLAEVFISLPDQDEVFIFANKKLRRRSKWLIAEREPTETDARRLQRLVQGAASFLAFDLDEAFEN